MVETRSPPFFSETGCSAPSVLEQNDESAVQRARLIPERWTAERTNLACWFDVLIQAKDI